MVLIKLQWDVGFTIHGGQIVGSSLTTKGQQR